jgi:hypothetical protein
MCDTQLQQGQTSTSETKKGDALNANFLQSRLQSHVPVDGDVDVSDVRFVQITEKNKGGKKKNEKKKVLSAATERAIQKYVKKDGKKKNGKKTQGSFVTTLTTTTKSWSYYVWGKTADLRFGMSIGFGAAVGLFVCHKLFCDSHNRN